MRHINIRYFFVADRVASKEVKVEYCPTGAMIADYFTKPLQGTLFRKFRDFIMNVDPLPTLTSLVDRRSVLEPGQDSGRESTVLSQDSETLGITLRQTEKVWTAVDHGKGKGHRHRMLRNKIRAKLTAGGG